MQDIPPPAINIIARALASEGIRGDHIEVQDQVGPTTGETNAVSRSNLASELVIEITTQQSASATTVRAVREVEVPSSQQEPVLKEASSSAATTGVTETPISKGVQGEETKGVSEIDALAQVAIGSSSPKDDISLFPEILSSTATAKTIE